mmetsp:Transcript_16751/g.34519  ORF Transcript_16751/g.34519 Transcript_16751/m.34519 type:complete len:321 (+) Transcript_16751:79-1041(+)
MSTTKRVQLGKALVLMGIAKGTRESKGLIRDRRVIVKGMIAVSVSTKVSVDTMEQEIEVLEALGEVGDVPVKKRQKLDADSGRSVQLQEYEFCAVYNKPCGMESTNATLDNGVPSFNNINPPLPSNFQAVGRLDRHSCGLLLFSNNGRLTSALLAPNSEVEREYEIVVRGRADSGVVTRRVWEGVNTDYGFFKGEVKSVRVMEGDETWEHKGCPKGSGGERNDKWDDNRKEEGGKDNDANVEDGVYSRIIVVVKEGKKRMVRRLFASLNLHVVNLKRLRYGVMELRNLEVGRWRYLNALERAYAKETIEHFEKGGKEWDK